MLADCRQMKCCERFKPHYVMLRGRCMRLDHEYQNGDGESYSRHFTFKTLDSRIISGKQRQYVVYFGDRWPEVGIFPRVYVTEGDYGVASFKLSRVNMLPRPDEALYGDIDFEEVEEFQCMPNCNRLDLAVDYTTSVIKHRFTFVLDVFYSDRGYEDYEEIAMVSLPGFISQVGGQLGLFLGVSVVSAIYLLQILSLKVHQMFIETTEQKIRAARGPQ
ncbi:unnamed protein product [Nippostrongylus brasiliensis]|uniref:Amiloride-sensitive sodium channel n=1 Tax=Nippostrongylus brasiliensis TaxID=27835 RepID=A0A0N4XDS7_NIPBR|nr:unnamed protein product [Nippostrongylus brasiliensis]